MYIYLSFYLSISLSLYIYIYIYMSLANFFLCFLPCSPAAHFTLLPMHPFQSLACNFPLSLPQSNRYAYCPAPKPHCSVCFVSDMHA